MISARALVASAVTAVFTGVVGFLSAAYLQHQSSQERMRELAAAHQLELERIEQEQNQRTERDRDLLTQGLYDSWTAQPLAGQATLARETIDRHPGLNYAQLLGHSELNEEEREALRAVVGFWMRVDDLSNDDSLDMERLTQRLGPAATGWEPHLEALVRELEQDSAYNSAFYARDGVKRVADLERQRGAGADRLPRRPPRTSNYP